MPHYDTFRLQLATAHSDFGHALWDTSPGELPGEQPDGALRHYPPVEIGDVGFIRKGKFHRLLNVLYSGDHPCNQRFGVPEDHEQLQHGPSHMDHGTLKPRDFCSYGVTTTSGGSNTIQGAGPAAPDSREASFSCTKKEGAVLCLPVMAKREDTLAQARFRKCITKNIDSWFAFSRRHELGIEMEDIVLVTGCHRTRSSTNIVFYESQVNAQVSLGVQVPSGPNGIVGTTVNWQGSSQHTRGTMVRHGPSGENLPENRCLFIRGFRVERTLRIFSKIRAAAEPLPDPSGGNDEKEAKMASTRRPTGYRDPLHVVLEYMAERMPHCDYVLVHDDDLERIIGVGDLTSLESLQPAEVMACLRILELEIGIMSESWPTNDNSRKPNTENMTVAMLSEHLRGLDHPPPVPSISHASVGTAPAAPNSDSEETVRHASSPSIVTPPAAPQATVSEPPIEHRTLSRSHSGDHKQTDPLQPLPQRKLSLNTDWVQQGVEEPTPPPYTSPQDDVRPTMNRSPAFRRALPTTDFSPSHSQSILRRLDAALKSYKKQTKRNLIAHPLVSRLLDCDSPEDILTVLQNQAAKFGSSWGGNEKLKTWLGPVVNVLYPFSTKLGEGVNPRPSPVTALFAGVGILLAARDGGLVDIFEHFGYCFRRLETYTKVPPTPAMMDKMVEITVGVLGILTVATKETVVRRGKTSLKKVAGKTDLEDRLKRLDKLTEEGARLASAEVNVNRTQFRANLKHWQSPPDPSTNHDIACHSQHEGTSLWFLEDGNFAEWKATGSLLWIHGKPGSGKSVLCSAIINNIKAMCEAGSASMAYFYFDTRDIDKQSCHNLLSSLLIQLTSRSDPFCDVLSRLYEVHDSGASQPSDGVLAQCLKEMLTLEGHGPVYLVMDALDECPNEDGIPSARAQVLNLIKYLVDLQLPSLHLCVTSRIAWDIGDSLRPLASHSISLHDASGQKKDIAEYVRSAVRSQPIGTTREWGDKDKEFVIKTLSERADGMFRWVRCQLEMLRQSPSQDVRSVLEGLPSSLDKTYERMLKEIGSEKRSRARRLFECLAVAIRPLRVQELTELLALDFDGAQEGMPKLNKDWRWDDPDQGVLSMCSSFIDIVDDPFSSSRVVKFTHFSVKQFMTSVRLTASHEDISFFHISLPSAHTTIAQACLGVLLQLGDDVNNDSPPPLANYAACHWVDHAQFVDVEANLGDGMRRLFDQKKPHFTAWLKLHNIDDDVNLFGGYDKTESRGPPLYYASLCGFRDLAAHLIAEHPQYVNTRGGLNHSPLVAALHKRHYDVANLLHKHGAALDVRGYELQTPLHAASAEGYADVVKWLLDHGADANSLKDGKWSPLNLAAANGQLEVVWMLLGHGGVDVNAANDEDFTPLHQASKKGHLEIVRLLLEHGANIHAWDWSQSTPLHLASFGWSANSETVKLLIKKGADVNALDGSRSTPLHLASFGWSAETAQLLIRHGAEVNVRDGKGSTPLHFASSAGSAETVQLLLQHGAKVEAEDNAGQTPLQVAQSGKLPNHKVVAQLLSDHRPK